MFDAQIEEVLRETTTAHTGLNPAETLVRTAVEQSGRDNTTAVVVAVH
jgi:serine/threonine protein phosphatase PrpC